MSISRLISQPKCWNQVHKKLLLISQIFPCWPVLSCNKKCLRTRLYRWHRYRWLRRNTGRLCQAAQHRPLLRRNVEGVKLEAAHCLKLEAVHCLSLRMQCNAKLPVQSWCQKSFKDYYFLEVEASYFYGSCRQKALSLDREQSSSFLHHQVHVLVG